MRVLTYNIHHGRGIDGVQSLERVADVIATAEADVVSLQEVMRGASDDQACRLAETLDMRWAFQGNHGRATQFGNLVLTKGTLRVERSLALPGGIERRGCLVTEISLDGSRFTFAATHLSLGPAARRLQLAHLATQLPRRLPLVLAGDLNSPRRDLGPLAARLTIPDTLPKTYPARKPWRTLDYVAFSAEWELRRLEAVPSPASDHLPLVAELERTTAPAE